MLSTYFNNIYCYSFSCYRYIAGDNDRFDNKLLLIFFMMVSNFNIEESL